MSMDCGYFNSDEHSFHIQTDLSIDILKSWLGQDRFGLDTEFVQEIIEQPSQVIQASVDYELQQQIWQSIRGQKTSIHDSNDKSVINKILALTNS